jgi:4-hydroxy-tetrahydrodipicolinate reductase
MTTEPLKIGIAGGLGRMGRAVTELVEPRDDATIAAVFNGPGTVGTVIGAYTLGTPADAAACDVVIDFSTSAASAALAAASAARAAPALVIGSTGWNDTEELAVWSAAKQIPIVKTGNFSLGVNILAGLVEQTARRLAAAEWDIEVAEAHHRRKVDAPSGTALMLGAAAAKGREVELETAQVRARDGITGARPEGAIGFSVVRGGGLVGEHSVAFIADDEVLTLSHSARDRRLFARGALAAAFWVAGKPPGLYDMMDVLGFR